MRLHSFLVKPDVSRGHTVQVSHSGPTPREFPTGAHAMRVCMQAAAAAEPSGRTEPLTTDDVTHP